MQTRAGQAHMVPSQTHDFCVTLDGSRAMAERAAGLLRDSLPQLRSNH